MQSGYVLIHDGNILKAFKDKDSASEYKNKLEEKDFEETKNELGFEDDLSEKEQNAIAFRSGYDNGDYEINFIDLKNRNEEDDDIPIGNDKFSFDEIKSAFDKAEEDQNEEDF